MSFSLLEERYGHVMSIYREFSLLFIACKQDVRRKVDEQQMIHENEPAGVGKSKLAYKLLASDRSTIESH